MSCHKNSFSEIPKWAPTFTLSNLHTYLIYSCFWRVQIFPPAQTKHIGWIQHGCVVGKLGMEPHSAPTALLRMCIRSAVRPHGLVILSRSKKNAAGYLSIFNTKQGRKAQKRCIHICVLIIWLVSYQWWCLRWPDYWLTQKHYWDGE